MNIKEKLAYYGLKLPAAAAAVAAYAPAVKTGNLVFVAGQLPVVDGKLFLTGKVGSDVTAEDAKKMAEICALNALAAISLVADIDQIKKIIFSAKIVLERGIENGGSSLRDKMYSDIYGKYGTYQDHFLIYERKNCIDCDTPIIKIKIKGRSSYYCPHCQPNNI